MASRNTGTRLAAVAALSDKEDPKVSSKDDVTKLFSTVKELEAKNKELADKKRSFEGAYKLLEERYNRLTNKKAKVDEALEELEGVVQDLSEHFIGEA